ncbi:hypothetical protein [Enterococcus lactis]|uniref:hypothetical protein n=1 Tax=Enterococcus lactis TaxID=357441 RepID=UPI004043154C
MEIPIKAQDSLWDLFIRPRVMAFKSVLTMILIIVGGVFILVFVELLWIVKMKQQNVRWSSVMFLGAGLMLPFYPAFIYFSGTINRLGITSEGLYRFVTNYIMTFDLSFVFVGLTIITFGISSLISKKFLCKKIN